MSKKIILIFSLIALFTACSSKYTTNNYPTLGIAEDNNFSGFPGSNDLTEAIDESEDGTEN